VRRAASVVLILLLPVLAAAASSGEEKEAPPTSAEKIAGRWRIVLEGLSVEHQEILASFAVDGEMLIGTLTVARETVNITSGRVVGTDFSFSFVHRSDEIFKMRGGVGPRGLEGTWEARGEKGRWRAERRQNG